jgi:molybdopterin converting factor small subunit
VRAGTAPARKGESALANVVIPALLRDLCGGSAKLEIPAANLRELLQALDQRCPGFFARVVEDGHIRPELAIAIDGEAASYPLHEPLRPNADVTIVPAIGGGLY